MPHPSRCWSIQTSWLRFLARGTAPAASPGCCSLDLSQRAPKSNPKSWNSAGKRGCFWHGGACPGGWHVLGGEGARQSPNFSGLAPGGEARGLWRGAQGQRSDAEDSSSSSARVWGRAVPVNIASPPGDHGCSVALGAQLTWSRGCRRSPIRAGAEQEGTGVPGVPPRMLPSHIQGSKGTRSGHGDPAAPQRSAALGPRCASADLDV